MKRFHVSLAVLAIVAAAASAFTTQKSFTADYKIYSEPHATVSSTASESTIVADGTLVVDLGTTSQDLPTYNSNNSISCATDAGFICDAEVEATGQTVLQVVQGDFSQL